MEYRFEIEHIDTLIVKSPEKYLARPFVCLSLGARKAHTIALTHMHAEVPWNIISSASVRHVAEDVNTPQVQSPSRSCGVTCWHDEYVCVCVCLSVSWRVCLFVGVCGRAGI